MNLADLIKSYGELMLAQHREKRAELRKAYQAAGTVLPKDSFEEFGPEILRGLVEVVRSKTAEPSHVARYIATVSADLLRNLGGEVTLEDCRRAVDLATFVWESSVEAAAKLRIT